MEEIKIIIIILLTIFSYAKLRSGQHKLQQLRDQKKTRQQEQEEQQRCSEQEPEEGGEAEGERPYLIDERYIEEFAKVDNELFPRNLRKPASTREDRQMAPQSRDSNDIFGGEYRKCVKGKILDMDNHLIYSNEYFQHKIFSHNNSPVFTNQQHLKTVQHLLRPLPFGFTSNQGRDMGPDSSTRNTYNNFSFNINIEREPMEAEDQNHNEEKEQDFQGAHKRSKKKLIAKPAKIGCKRRYRRQQQPSVKAKPCTGEVRRKKKTMICLQDEIRQKRQELEMLERLQRSRTK